MELLAITGLAFQGPAMILLAIVGLTFLGIHLLPATPLRPAAVSAMGEKAYLAAYSLLSIVLIIVWVGAFNNAPYGPGLWSYPLWWPWLKALILLFAAILAVGGFSQPNPTLPQAGKLLERADVADGIFAITRHPAMWAFGLWGIAHFVSQPNWRGFWFFGLFAITALLGAWLQDHRKAETYGQSWDGFAAKTSFVPFVAIFQGRARLSLSEIGWWRIALALAIWALLLHLHVWLFGAVPIPSMSG